MRALLALLLALFTTVNLVGFDGELLVFSSDGGQIVESTMIVKGNQMKQILPDDRGKFIIDYDAGTMTNIMDKAKMFSVQAYDPEKAGFKIDGQVRDTGKTDVVLGYKVKKLILSEKNGNETVCWATNELDNPALTRLPGVSPQMRQQLVEIFGDDRIFAMQMETFDRNGLLLLKMAVKDITEREVAAAEMQPPADYQEVGMPMFSPSGQ